MEIARKHGLEGDGQKKLGMHLRFYSYWSRDQYGFLSSSF